MIIKKYQSKSKRASLGQEGFTIVELFMVIVVLGILMVIVLVSLNGVQQRANNTTIKTGVKDYEKALTQYAVVNGSYPSYTGTGACLGADYPSDKCWDGPNGDIFIQAGMDAALAKYLGEIKPKVSTKRLKVTDSPDYRLGLAYSVYDGPTYQLVYYLEGPGQTCINGGSGATEMEGTQCRITLPAPNSY